MSFDLEKPHFYEIWVNKDRTEAGMFSPEQANQEQYKRLTYDVDGKKMRCIANMRCSYWDAKIIYDIVVQEAYDQYWYPK